MLAMMLDRIEPIEALTVLACVIAGLAVMMLPIVATVGRPAVTVASSVIFGGFAGGLVTVAMAAGAYIGLGIESRAYWFVFLAATVAAMVAKLAVVLPALRDAQTRVPSTDGMEAPKA